MSQFEVQISLDDPDALADFMEKGEAEHRIDALKLENENQSLRRRRLSRQRAPSDNSSLVAECGVYARDRETQSLAQCDTYARDRKKVNDWLDRECRDDTVPKTAHGVASFGPQQAMNVLCGAFPFGLPNFKIKVFNGDPAEWPEWILNFKSLIHENAALSEGQKMGYLRTYLGTEPQSRVFGLLLDGKNYSRTLKELETRYGNPTFVVEAYINKIRQFPRISKTLDIISFSTLVSQLVQIFQTMGYLADLEAK